VADALREQIAAGPAGAGSRLYEDVVPARLMGFPKHPPEAFGCIRERAADPQLSRGVFVRNSAGQTVSDLYKVEGSSNAQR